LDPRRGEAAGAAQAVGRGRRHSARGAGARFLRDRLQLGGVRRRSRLRRLHPRLSRDPAAAGADDLDRMPRSARDAERGPERGHRPALRHLSRPARRCLRGRQSRALAELSQVDDLFATHDALAVADLIRARKLGAREVLDATLASLRKANERLNAVTAFYDGELLAKSVAAARDGPFHGIPYVIKQLMADCAGTPTTLGSKFFAEKPV